MDGYAVRVADVSAIRLGSGSWEVAAGHPFEAPWAPEKPRVHRQTLPRSDTVVIGRIPGAKGTRW
jgi:hypothetical protein